MKIVYTLSIKLYALYVLYLPSPDIARDDLTLFPLEMIL